MIRIIIADDHRLIRDGIKAMLAKNNEFELVGEAEDGEDLLKQAEEKAPDVILVDITMPKVNGIEVISKLKKTNPNIKSILLTMHEEPEYIIKGAKSGASGYLLKNIEYEELQLAIKTVAAGQKYFNASVSKILIDNISNSKEEETDQEKLTAREVEVLREIVNGLSTKQIGEKLFISARTVETHRVNIMKKLDVHNTAELVKKALDKKLI